MDNEFTFSTKLWIMEAPTPWYLITVPEHESSYIKRMFGHLHRGWGSIPVKVQIGETTWNTSIFWEKKGTYVMPVKKEVRIKEDIKNGDSVKVGLTLEV